ncbi:MAG: hypothetical protein M1383_03210 [Patescibacteria group bacterium]|nr:hypothetical protein [Patescibacteria group bacterium]
MKKLKFAILGLASGLVCGILAIKLPLHKSFFIIFWPGIIFGMALSYLFWKSLHWRAVLALVGSMAGWVAAGFIAVITTDSTPVQSLFAASLAGTVILILGIRAAGLKFKIECLLIATVSVLTAILQPVKVYNITNNGLLHYEPNYLLLFSIWQTAVLYFIGRWWDKSQKELNLK